MKTGLRKVVDSTSSDIEARPSEVAAPCDCSIVLTEGEIVDLTGMEDWLSTMEVLRPRLGEGVRRRWLKTLASILDQSNVKDEVPK